MCHCEIDSQIACEMMMVMMVIMVMMVMMVMMMVVMMMMTLMMMMLMLMVMSMMMMTSIVRSIVRVDDDDDDDDENQAGWQDAKARRAMGSCPGHPPASFRDTGPRRLPQALLHRAVPPLKRVGPITQSWHRLRRAGVVTIMNNVHWPFRY